MFGIKEVLYDMIAIYSSVKLAIIIIVIYVHVSLIPKLAKYTVKMWCIILQHTYVHIANFGIKETCSYI